MARILVFGSVLLGLLVPGAAVLPARAATCSGRPVLLVHDFAATAASVQPLARRLADSGRCVRTRTYGVYPGGVLGGMRSLEDSADELARWIRSAAGAGKVDVVAHGAGSLAVVRALRDAVDLGRPLPVATSVALGGAWSGTNVLLLGDLDLASRDAGTYDTVLRLEKLLLDGVCAACREVVAHSDFLADLRRDGVVVPGVRQVNVVTRYDELIAPYTSGTHSRMRNVVLQDRAPGSLTEHLLLPADPAVAVLVGAALRCSICSTP